MPLATAAQLPAEAPPPAQAPHDADAGLIERAVAGDTAAFGALIDRHERAALAVAYAGCGDAAKAADAVQEACLLAWRKRATLAEPARFSGWLLNIVRRCATDQVRRNRLRLPPPETVETVAGPADAESAAEEEAGRVRAALASLDEESRLAVTMRYFDDRPSRQIADVLGCSAAAVDMRLKRARDRLRALLGGSE